MVQALRLLEHRHPELVFEHVEERYGRKGVLDPEWIPDVGPLGYRIITADHEQKSGKGKKAVESELYRENKAIGFWLPKWFVNPGKKSDGEPKTEHIFTQASFFFKIWSQLKWEAARAKPGDIFDIDLGGKIKKRP